MRRMAGALVMLLMVGWIGFGGGPGEWSSDGAVSYSSSIVVQNTSSDVAAVVNVVYQTPCDPTTPDYQVTVPAGTSQVVNVNDAFPGPWNGAAVVSSDVPIVATQTFLWADSSGATQWAANSGSVPAASTSWYLAEGSTSAGFESYIVIQNPGSEPAQVAVTYTTPGATHSGPQLVVDPISQAQVSVGETVPDSSSIGAIVTSDVPVVAQLSTYWNGGASVSSTFGSSTPANTWYLAEGSTDSWSGFETWITVQNTGGSTASVDVTFLADGEQMTGPSFDVAPMTHTTFDAASSLPNQSHFSAVVTSDAPIVAVQTMRWNGHAGYDGTPGVTAPLLQWVFPVTRPHGSSSSWLAVQNVGGSSANVNVSYVTGSGTTTGPTLSLTPFGHGSLSLPDEVNGQFQFSAVVTSDQPILVLVGNYWETSAGAHRDMSFGFGGPSAQWYLPISPHAPSQSPSSSGPSDDGASGKGDRDGDGVPDDEDYCPDFPGSEAMNGC